MNVKTFPNCKELHECQLTLETTMEPNKSKDPIKIKHFQVLGEHFLLVVDIYHSF